MLKWRYPFLIDEDFSFEFGGEENMLKKLAVKLKKTTAELKILLAELKNF